MAKNFSKTLSTADVCYHPDTLHMAHSNADFMKMNVHQNAIEQVNSFHKLKLSVDPKTFKKVVDEGDKKFIGEVDNNIKLSNGAFADFQKKKSENNKKDQKPKYPKRKNQKPETSISQL